MTDTTNDTNKPARPLAVPLSDQLVPLIERLRKAGADYTVAWGSGELYDEAADALERLRSELAEAVTALPQAVRNERERCERWAFLEYSRGYIFSKIQSGEPAPE